MYMEWTASFGHMMRCIIKNIPEFKVTVIGRNNVLIEKQQKNFLLE